jgi:mannitol-specific phosphotransferase system IIBC component
MGTSSDEIDKEIRETRTQLDQKLRILQQRAASGARRYRRVVAGVAAGMVAVAIAAIVYKRRRQHAAVKQLPGVLFQSVRNLPDEVTSRLKRQLPIKVVVTDKVHEERSQRWNIALKILPSVAGAATGALVSRMVGRKPPELAASE